jgi:hypothetical protein
MRDDQPVGEASATLALIEARIGPLPNGGTSEEIQAWVDAAAKVAAELDQEFVQKVGCGTYDVVGQHGEEYGALDAGEVLELARRSGSHGRAALDVALTARAAEVASSARASARERSSSVGLVFERPREHRGRASSRSRAPAGDDPDPEDLEACRRVALYPDRGPCENCGRPVHSRKQDSTYCFRVDCRRARKAALAAEERALECGCGETGWPFGLADAEEKIVALLVERKVTRPWLALEQLVHAWRIADREHLLEVVSA